MANNQNVNKVEYEGQTLMDLTGDTVTPNDVRSGVTFHDRSGAAQQGGLIISPVYDGLDSSSTTDALSANQGKTIKTAFASLGEIQSGTTNTQTISVPNETVTSVGKITLTKGVWIVVACINWQSNSTGYRQVAIDRNTMNPSRDSASTTTGVNGKETYQQVTKIVNVTADSSELTIYALQSSGAALNAYPYIYAVRVGAPNSL